MEKIAINSNLSNVIEGLPDSWGVFAFYRGEECLLYSKSGNLRFRLGGMFHRKDEDLALSRLFLEADSISYEVFHEPILALISEKVFLQKHDPLFQHDHQVWKAYPYLAIDASNFPFVQVVDHTNANHLYIGPFRSRFFLADVIDTYGRILKLPYCQSGVFPCERLDKGLCRGYCLSLEGNSNKETGLDKLDALLKEAYLHPHNGILELVQKEKQHYFDELEFDKVDLLNDETDLLGKYRDWLSFLYVAKDLEFETDFCSVKGGLLQHALHQGKTHHFAVAHIPYRENEALALNKDIIDECRILYTYYTKNIANR